jgi:dihydroflavonol-4-reductase
VKLLVTGATGFLGRALTKKLIDIGHDVRILTRGRSADLPWTDAQVENVIGDVTDLDSLRKAVRDCHSVFHLAGLIGYSRSMYQQMVLANVVGTSNVLDAAVENGIQKFIHMSSVVAVGASFDGKSPLTEDSSYNLSHLHLGYFETKRRAELLVRDAAQKKKIFALCLNPSTVYGAGDATKGSRKTQIKVAKGQMPFYTSGGVNVIHVDDVVNATYRSWEIGVSGERYILSGENITIKQLFTEIAHAAGVRPPSIYLPNICVHALGRIGDFLEKIDRKGPLNSENAWTATMFHWFDSSKAQRELGLRPRSAQLAIRESVQWMKEKNLI